MTVTQKQAFIQNQWVPAITYLEPMEEAKKREECSDIDGVKFRLMELEVPKDQESAVMQHIAHGALPLLHLSYLTAKKD